MRHLELDAPGIAAPCGNCQRLVVIIVGQDRMHADPKGSSGDPHELTEEAVDGVPASVVARRLATPAAVPQNVHSEEVVQRREVPLGERSVPVPDTSDVGMLSYGRLLRYLKRFQTVEHIRTGRPRWVNSVIVGRLPSTQGLSRLHVQKNALRD